ncbi:MAG TPA: hypothetical protein VGH73_13565, partial [Thermoanaerobaculia bacterium]
IKSSWDITARIRKLDDGQQVPLEVWRNGKAQNVSAAIVERERPELDMTPFFKGEDGERLMLKMNPEDFKGLQELKSADGMKHLQIRRLGSPREAEMEKQIKELEKRIAELEKQIKKP